MINADSSPILFPSSCSSASFTLLAQESKDSDRTFNRCNMANNSSRVYLYLQSEEITENNTDGRCIRKEKYHCIYFMAIVFTRASKKKTNNNN